MSRLSIFEQDAIAEYGAVRAWIAVQPVVSVLLALVAGGLIGWLL